MSKNQKLEKTNRVILNMLRALKVPGITRVVAKFRPNRAGYVLNVSIQTQNTQTLIDHMERVFPSGLKFDASTPTYQGYNTVTFLTEVETICILKPDAAAKKFGFWINDLAQPANINAICKHFEGDTMTPPPAVQTNEVDLLSETHPDPHYETELFNKLNVMGIAYLDLLIFKLHGGKIIPQQQRDIILLQCTHASNMIASLISKKMQKAGCNISGETNRRCEIKLNEDAQRRYERHLERLRNTLDTGTPALKFGSITKGFKNFDTYLGVWMESREGQNREFRAPRKSSTTHTIYSDGAHLTKHGQTRFNQPQTRKKRPQHIMRATPFGLWGNHNVAPYKLKTKLPYLFAPANDVFKIKRITDYNACNGYAAVSHKRPLEYKLLKHASARAQYLYLLQRGILFTSLQDIINHNFVNQPRAEILANIRRDMRFNVGVYNTGKKTMFLAIIMAEYERCLVSNQDDLSTPEIVHLKSFRHAYKCLGFKPIRDAQPSAGQQNYARILYIRNMLNLQVKNTKFRNLALEARVKPRPQASIISLSLVAVLKHYQHTCKDELHTALKSEGILAKEFYSIGVPAKRLKELNFSIRELLECIPISELKPLYSLQQMLEENVPIKQLSQHFTVQDLVTAGASLKLLIEAELFINDIVQTRSFSVQELKACGITAGDLLFDTSLTESDLINDYSIKELLQGDASISNLLAAGKSVEELIHAGTSSVKMQEESITIQEMIVNGATTLKLIYDGIAVEALLQTPGVDLALLHREGVAVAHLLQANISLSDCRKHYSLENILKAKPDLTELLNEGISYQQLVDADVDLSDALSAGLSIAELQAAGISCKQLVDAGVNIQSALDAQLSVADLATAGVTPQQFYDADTDPQALLKTQIPLTDLLAAGFPIITLLDKQPELCKNQPLTELVACVVSGKTLVNAGFNHQDLIKAGASVRQLQAANMSIADMVDAKIPTAKLHHAGISYREIVLKSKKDITHLGVDGVSASELLKEDFTVSELLSNSYATTAIIEANLTKRVECNVKKLVRQVLTSGITNKNRQTLFNALSTLNQYEFTRAAHHMSQIGFGLRSHRARRAAIATIFVEAYIVMRSRGNDFYHFHTVQRNKANKIQAAVDILAQRLHNTNIRRNICNRNGTLGLLTKILTRSTDIVEQVAIEDTSSLNRHNTNQPHQ